MIRVALIVDGRDVALEVEARTTLTDALPPSGVTSVPVGCEHGVCGACTVILDGRPVRACLLFAIQCDGATIVTAAGLAKGDALTPLQEALRDHHALQCGFCTPGVLTAATALLNEQPDACDETLDDLLAGHLCRCTGYVGLRAALRTARDAAAGTAP